MKLPANPKPLVIAHRGASGYRPEHSAAAYELALDLGAEAIEPDIVATKDGILVLRHENEISGTTDVADHSEFADRRTTKVIEGAKVSGWFTEDFTWAELSTLHARERLPKFRGTHFDDEGGIQRLTDLIDLLDERGGEVGLVAEIKHANYFESIGLPLDELFAAELSAAGWENDPRLTVECFEPTVLTQIRDRGIRARYVFLMESSGAPADQVARFGAKARKFSDYLTDDGLAFVADRNEGLGFDGISVDKRILLTTDAAGHVTGITDLVTRAHRAGLLVYCWTLRAENNFLAKNLRGQGSPREFGQWKREFQLIMGSGLDGVFTDQPDLAVKARSEL